MRTRDNVAAGCWCHCENTWYKNNEHKDHVGNKPYCGRNNSKHQQLPLRLRR